MFAALKRMFVDPRQQLIEVLGDEQLPSFPAVHMRVLKLLRDPDSDHRRIAEQLSSDPGLSVKMLRTVNSAAIGLRRPVNDVGHAMTLLGRSTVEGLVLGLAVNQTTPQRPVQGYDPNAFWQTAAKRAATAKAIADALEPRHRMVAFTAGMLQDMALPLLAHRKQGYGAVLRAWQHREGPLEQLERGEFGWTHADVGHWLASDWQFPEDLGAAIGGHHDRGEGIAAVQLVSLLDEACRSEGLVEAACARYGSAAADKVVEAVQRGQEHGEALAALLR